MRVAYWNIGSAALVALIAVAFELGAISPGNAFFGLFAVVGAFMAQQLIAREGVSWSQAFRSMFGEPESHGSQGNYMAFVAATAIG